MMDSLQILVAVLLGVVFIPGLLIFLFVWLCCRKDVCHLKPQSSRRRDYRPMISLLAHMTNRDDDGGDAETPAAEGGEEKKPNPEQTFASPPAPQFE